jgi:hypothetical protein|tara:strand:+ start:3009 stop:3560 length:552 start_codon:yes stop_codon:yes gene_type:complete
MAKLNNFKYKVIKNFLSEDELKIYGAYAKSKHEDNVNSFDVLQNNNGDTAFYKDPLFNFLQSDKHKIIEEATGIKLLYTYNFWRCYTYNAILKKHKDRPSCELSATLFIDSDGTDWPIFFDGKAIHLEKGDILIYNGCDYEHWREPFKGDYQIQLFLHFVDANGKYANLKNDPLCGKCRGDIL